MRLMDEALVSRLRAGDEEAFVELVNQYHASMVRVARSYVRDNAAAEEVAQDAWVAVLAGIDRFEGRGSLKSWIFSIVVNRARTRGKRDARSTPFSALIQEEVSRTEVAVPPERFQGPEGRHPDGWALPPTSWGRDPAMRLEEHETMRRLRALIDDLPQVQRTVLTLRDIADQDPATICNILGITETNMRVLLHRARSRVRAGMERYFEQSEA